MRESEEGAARKLLAAQISAACGSQTPRCRRLVLVDGAEMEPCIASRAEAGSRLPSKIVDGANALSVVHDEEKKHTCQMFEVREHRKVILFAVINPSTCTLAVRQACRFTRVG
jgi:hypothetical protein